jgi:hypothetical protein
MKRLKAVETPPPERTEGTMRWENMDNISGMVERGRNITNDTVIPDYIKYLKKKIEGGRIHDKVSEDTHEDRNNHWISEGSYCSIRRKSAADKSKKQTINERTLCEQSVAPLRHIQTFQKFCHIA